MARIRTIKPEFWEDEKIGRLPIPCRLFYIGCWNFADDFGCIKNNAALLKSQIFPYDETLRVSEVKKWIDALVNARMLIPIIDDDAPASGSSRESYYVIRTFRSHQVLDSRFERSCISKDKEYVKSLINKAFENYDVFTTCSRRNHDVITTLEMEKEMEKENNPSIIPPRGDEREVKDSENLDNSLSDPTPELRGTPSPDFVKFREWINDNASRVAKMKEPFTESQFSALKKDFDTNFICDLLRAMHNHEPLLKNNHSAYLTFLNWAKRRENDHPHVGVGRSKHAIASFNGKKEFKKF